MKKIGIGKLEDIVDELNEITDNKHLTVADGIEDKYVIMSVSEYDMLKKDAESFRYALNEQFGHNGIIEPINLRLDEEEFEELKKVLMKYMGNKGSKK